MTPAEEMRNAAQKLHGLLHHVMNDLYDNPYWGPVDTSVNERYARGVKGGLGGPAGDLAAVFDPATVYAIAQWLTIAADYSDKWPPDAQTGSPFRQQGHLVARSINGPVCDHCKGSKADPEDEDDYVPEVHRHNPFSVGPCPRCDGTGYSHTKES